MKSFMHGTLLLCCFVFISKEIFPQQKQIKVQIMHADKVIIDTTLYKTSDEAKVIIENLVQRFSTDPVTIDTKLTHGLYVFNISNDTWKDPKSTTENADAKEKITPKTAEPPNESSMEKADKTADIVKEPTMEQAETKIDRSMESTGFDDMDMDSLYREFSKELDTHWNEAHIDIMMDSVGSSFKQIWEEIKSGDFQNDPDIKNLQKDFEQLFEKIKTTQIIIIQNSDTLKVD